MKKVLVVSNGCFSLTDSNGRTLSKLFKGYDPGCLAQVFTYGSPDFSVCDNFYKITDKAIIKSFITRKSGGYVVEDEVHVETTPVVIRKKAKRTPFRKLVREFIWKHSNWQKGTFNQWIGDFSPEAIVVFAGDSGFIMDVARQTAEKYNIPIVIYTTEDYVFKKYNYLTKRPSLFYKFFYKKLEKSYREMEPYVEKGFFNTPMLTEEYKKAFKFPCECLFARSDIDFVPAKTSVEKDEIKVSYLGNLGLNRHIPLLEIADALGRVSPGTKLNIYGTATEDVVKAFEGNKNVDYRGFVGYDDVVRIIHESDLVVHAEYDEPFNLLDLKAAFSTKIPDSISSGTPLLIYANESLACTDFIIKNKSGFVASNKDDLDNALKQALFDEKRRAEIIRTAQDVRNKFFTSDCSLSNYFADSEESIL